MVLDWRLLCTVGHHHQSDHCANGHQRRIQTRRHGRAYRLIFGDLKMAYGSPFRPTGTAALSASTTSSAVLLAGGGDSVVVTNTSASLAYVRFGADTTVTASNADMPVMAGGRA